MIRSTLRTLWNQALPIWRAGGWGMIALAIDGVVIVGLGLRTLLRLIENGAMANVEKAWSDWHLSTEKVRGPWGPVIKAAMQRRSPEAIEAYFAELHREEFASFDLDLRVMKVAVAAAPLLGLLGTVTGMLTTFRGLAEGGGGEKTMSLIASGISEALITTETGLVLGLSGLIFQFILSRQHDKFNKMVERLESRCLKEWIKREAQRELSERRAA